MSRIRRGACASLLLMRVSLIFMIVAVLHSVPAKASLNTLSGGSLVTPTSSGVTATGNWDSSGVGFKISWTVTDTHTTTSGGNEIWSYSYTISDASGNGLVGGLSHWIMSVSSTFTSADIWNVQGNTNQEGGPTTYTSTSDGNSNPNLPGPIFGIKFGGTADPATTSFYSDRAPTWGDFYAKDGTAGTQGQTVDTAWNSGFGTTPTNPFQMWISRPDTTSGVTDLGTVPEPSTMALAALGGLGFLGYSLRRRLKK
jgi:hypothetical protein